MWLLWWLSSAVVVYSVECCEGEYREGSSVEAAHSVGSLFGCVTVLVVVLVVRSELELSALVLGLWSLGVGVVVELEVLGSCCISASMKLGRGAGLAHRDSLLVVEEDAVVVDCRCGVDRGCR